jgi:hypothetical protein
VKDIGLYLYWLIFVYWYFCKEISEYLRKKIIFLNQYSDYFLLSNQRVSYIHTTKMTFTIPKWSRMSKSVNLFKN